MTLPTARSAPPEQDAALRDIEAFVREIAVLPPEPAERLPDLETVARELRISVAALRAIRETALG